jgi:hypothetical protein
MTTRGFGGWICGCAQCVWEGQSGRCLARRRCVHLSGGYVHSSRHYLTLHPSPPSGEPLRLLRGLKKPAASCVCRRVRTAAAVGANGRYVLAESAVLRVRVLVDCKALQLTQLSVKGAPPPPPTAVLAVPQPPCAGGGGGGGGAAAAFVATDGTVRVRLCLCLRLHRVVRDVVCVCVCVCVTLRRGVLKRTTTEWMVRQVERAPRDGVTARDR